MQFFLTTSFERFGPSRTCLICFVAKWNAHIYRQFQMTPQIIYSPIPPRTQKRGRICIALSQGACLLGEATLVDCVCVGILDTKTKKWTPANDTAAAQENFILNPQNSMKHQIGDPASHDMFATSTRLFAWVLSDVVPYKEPVPYQPKQGAVVFVDLAGRVPSDMVDTVTCLLPVFICVFPSPTQKCSPQEHAVILFCTFFGLARSFRRRSQQQIQVQPPWPSLEDFIVDLLWMLPWTACHCSQV